MKMKMKNSLLISDINLGTRINRPRTRHEHEYSKYRKFLSMTMLIYIKQHLSDIWSWIHKKVKQHWGWIEKKRCLYKKKKCVTFFHFHLSHWHYDSTMKYDSRRTWANSIEDVISEFNHPIVSKRISLFVIQI